MSDKFFALYARVSTESQSTGLESQIRALKEFCELKQIKNYKIYEDFGISGSRSSRPQLDAMMNDINAGLVDTVVVFALSRLARSTKNLILSLETFDRVGVKLVSLSEQIDFSSVMGRSMYQLLAVVGELEKELIRDRIVNGIKNAKAKGRQLGAKPKYTNYEIFLELSKKGLSSRKIAKIMKTSHSTVNRILKKVGT